MSTYSSYDRFGNYAQREKKSRTPLWVWALDLVMFFVTIASCISIIVALMSQYIDAERGWIFPIMGLMAPITYIIGVVSGLYWIIRWRMKMALIMIAVLLVGYHRVSLYLNIPLKRDYHTESYRNTIKVVSYNVRGLRDGDWHSTHSQVADYLNNEQADIICLQEVPGNKILEEIDPRGRYSEYSNGELAIYSRYPILARGVSLDHKNWESGNSIYVDLLINKDTVRLFNNHLHSTHIKKEDDDYLTSTRMVRDESRSDRLGDIVKRVQTNAIERRDQVLIVSEKIASTPHKVIVCGDFNETPLSYSYNKLSQGLTDAFEACGENYSYTYRGFFNMLRIDYILTSEGITPRSYTVDDTMDVSDHMPVVVRLKIDK